MILLTNLAVKTTAKDTIWCIIESYLTCWAREKSVSSMKQCYSIEDMRVGHYTSILSLVTLSRPFLALP